MGRVATELLHRERSVVWYDWYVLVCYSVMQYFAMHGSLLHRVAVCCCVLQCVAVCCSVSQCVAVCCSVLQCVAVCCIKNSLAFRACRRTVATRQMVLWHERCVAACCSVVQCVAAWCSVLQRVAICSLV